jgi:PST family polysaccharide transporter
MNHAGEPVSKSREARGGFFWTTLGVGVQAGMQIPVLAVLARHISPEEFGIANAALLVIGLGLNVFEGGVALNVAQRKNIDLRDEAVAFQISVVLALAVLGVVTSTSGLLSGFFGRPEIKPAIVVVAWSFLLSGLTAVAEALLYNRGAYRTAASVNIVSYVVGYAAVAVILALKGYSYWSLIYAQITMKLVKLGLLLGWARHAVWVRPTLAVWREHLGQTLAFSLGRVATYLANEGDMIVVGRILGVEALGFYGRAHQLMMVPNKVFIKVAIRVSTPLYASIQDDLPRVGRAFLHSVRLTNQAMIPVTAYLVLFRREIVQVLLGPSWSEVTALLAILAVAGFFHVIYKVPLSVMHAQRLARNSAFSQSIFAVCLLLAVLAVASRGLPAVAWAVTTVTAANYVFISSQIVRRLGVAPAAYLQAHLPGLLGGGLLLAAVLLLRAVLDGALSAVAIAALGGLALAAVVGGSLRRFLL